MVKGKFARFVLKRQFPTGLLTYSDLNVFGLSGTIQGPRRFRKKGGELLPWAERALQILRTYAMSEESEAESVIAYKVLEDIESSGSSSYDLVPKGKKNAIVKNGVPVYPRDPKVAAHALELANHSCEIDGAHLTFI